MTALTVRPLSSAIGAEISGVDLSRDVNDIVIGEIRQALLDHCVIFFREQEIDTEQHKRLMARGGTSDDYTNSDGAYNRRAGSFGNQTAGAIPKNVLSIPHRCQSQDAYKNAARAAGVPVHGAPMPLALARFAVSLLTREGETVMDPFMGSGTTAVACEELGRHWLAAESAGEYVYGAAHRLVDCAGFAMNENVSQLIGVSGSH